MKKTIGIVLLMILVLVGCTNEAKVTLSDEIETDKITTGIIQKIWKDKDTGEYKVRIVKEDDKNKCTWFNECYVSKKEFNELEVGDKYTIKE